MGWVFVSPQIPVQPLTPTVMVLRGGAFGRQLELEKVMSVELPGWH